MPVGDERHGIGPVRTDSRAGADYRHFAQHQVERLHRDRVVTGADAERGQRAARAHHSEGLLVGGRRAHCLYDEVRPAAAGELFHLGHRILAVLDVDRHVHAELFRDRKALGVVPDDDDRRRAPKPGQQAVQNGKGWMLAARSPAQTSCSSATATG